MKKLLFCITILVFAGSFAQISPKQMIESMGRGINLGNVFSAPQEGSWSPIVEEQYFIDAASAGFNTVRIPMDFFGTRIDGDTSIYSSAAGTENLYTGSTSDYTVSNTYLNRIEEVVDWAIGQDLVVIIDLHGKDLKNEFIYTFDDSKTEYTNPTSAKRSADMDKIKAIWLAIANRLKDKSNNYVVFEVINEPYFHINNTEMDTINAAIIAAIRGTGGNNLTRNIIITGGTKNSYEAPTTIAPTIIANDDYLIATFHYYLPFKFTSSSKDGISQQYTWGSVTEKSIVDAHFDTVLSWSIANDIPVLLGEFGADNTMGYKYSAGDLLTINSNATGFASGGPDNASRVEYHRYVAEQAINRGFAFTVWDAGPKSNKTIHMRSDSNISVNYDITNFSVVSHVPKNTTPSSIIDNSTWVTDVKDALFSSGTWPRPCNNIPNLITNHNFECGYNDNWSLLTLGSAVASFSDALTDSKTGFAGAKVDVSTADVYNKVILKNTTYTQDLTNKSIAISCFAKASTANQSLKLRVKVLVNGSYIYSASSTINLTESYPSSAYEFTYVVPDNATSFEVQVLLGDDAGIYYIDDFGFTINNVDADADGYNKDEDCNDNDSGINPGAAEVLYNGIDDDCNPLTLDTEDIDNDGYNSDVDCNDNDAAINPGVTEILNNSIDDDCNTSTSDVGYALLVNATNGSVSIDSGIFPENTNLTLTATPDSGYEFSSWSEDASGTSNPLTITMDGNKTITANFTKILTSATLTPIDDAFVRNGVYKNDNYGSYNKMHIREINTNGLKRISYLKFDLSNISNITSATLRLNNTGANGDVLLKKVSNDNWTEHDIIWNGRPAVGANIGTYLFTGMGTFDMDVTSYVSAEANGDGVVSFALKGVTSNFMAIWSKESGNAPELIVEYSNSSAKSSNNKTVLATQNFEDDTTVFVYPNPTTSQLNFKINNADVGKGKIQVFDVTGRLINTKVITGGSMQLQLEGSSGLYIVKIKNKGNTTIKRIVKQ